MARKIVERGRVMCVIPAAVPANAAISPGTMVRVNSSGKAAAVAANDLTNVIVEEKLAGGVTDAYVADEETELVALVPGVEFYGLVNKNSAITVAAGTMATAASGYFTDSSTNANIVAELLEAHAASSSAVLRLMRKI